MQIVHVVTKIISERPTRVLEFSSVFSSSLSFFSKSDWDSCSRTHIQLFGEGSENFAGKSVDKRIHEWTDQEIKMMLAWGNFKANVYSILVVEILTTRLWGGKMTEEQATEEGR